MANVGVEVVNGLKVRLLWNEVWSCIYTVYAGPCGSFHDLICIVAYNTDVNVLGTVVNG